MAARLFATRTRKGTSAAAQWEKPNLTHEFKGHEGDIWEEPILKHEFEGHEKEIWNFVFLHDNLNIHIVSGSADGTMRKWNCNTGRAVGKPWKGKGGSIYALALSPDGKMIASGSEDGSIQRWNTDGEMMEGVWTSHSDWVQSLSWSPSGIILPAGLKMGQSSSKKQKVDKSQWARSRRSRRECMLSHIHLQKKESHPADTTLQFVSGTRRPASLLFRQSDTWGKL
jgi:WD40 repeat protein